MPEENAEQTGTDDVVPDENTCAADLCEAYASQAENLPEYIKVLVKPVVTKEGREACMFFSYGEKRYKVTFEEVSRVKPPRKGIVP